MGLIQDFTWRGFARGFAPKPGHLRRTQRQRLETISSLCATLLSTRGELGGIRLASQIADLYDQMEEAETEVFFGSLVRDFDPALDRATAAANAYLEDPSPDNACLLAAAVEAPRQELIRRLNMAPGGTARILKMRERVLGMDKSHPELAPLASDLHHLLGSWFNRGFLELRQITWNTSAAVLEKLIKYEAVHAIRDWDDLRQRVHGNRRCYGFFHPALPNEPLIFVEVALTTNISSEIGPLLAKEPLARTHERQPRTAIFYSISNCQPGLNRISLGNFLIKQVVADLNSEIPSLKDFATLSPIPGFRRWLEKAVEKEPSLAFLKEPLADPQWFSIPEAERLRESMLVLCARYLKGLKADGSPGGTVDPVAKFHLSNGARLERINWRANLSPKGLQESCGLMVNYRYLPKHIENNHESFVDRGIIIHSRKIANLLDQSL